MRRSLWVVGVLILLLAISTSTAFAQGGDGDKLIVGQNYVLAAGERLNGSLTMIGGNASLEASSLVNGDVAVMGGTLRVGGTIHGSVAMFGGSVSLADTAVVEGDLATFGGSVQRAPGAVISGEVFQGPRLPEIPRLPEMPGVPITPELPRVAIQRGGPVSVLVSVLVSIMRWQFVAVGWGLLLALLGVVAVLMAPKAMGRIASAAAGEPGLSFGVGLLTLIVALLAGTLLLIACGLGLLIWLVAWIAFIIGWIGIGLWVGQRLLRALQAKNASSLFEVALGVFLITLLGRMPWCIGFLFTVAVGAVGLGAVVLTRFGTQPPDDVRRASTGSAGGPDTGPVSGLPTVAHPIAESEPVVAPPGGVVPAENQAVLVAPALTDVTGDVPEKFDAEDLPMGEIPPERILAEDDLEVIAGIGPLQKNKCPKIAGLPGDRRGSWNKYFSGTILAQSMPGGCVLQAW